MRDLLLAELAEEIVVQAPADIVVAAEIIQEDVLLRQGEDLTQLVRQEPYVPRGHGMPDRRHGRHVVEEMTFRLLHGAEVRDDLVRRHHDLAQEERAGADDLADDAHDPDEGVDLLQIPAGRPRRLPDIGHRVQADDVDAAVAEEEQVLRHVVEDGGIGIVQVPLVGVEGRHDDLLRLLTPGEAARGRGREDLGHRFLVPVGDVPVVIKEIAVLELLLAGAGPARPFVVLAGVIHDKVQADSDAAVMAGVRQGGQVIHGAQVRLDLPEVADRVAAVAAALRAFQQGHEVEIVDAGFRKVVQLRPDAPEGSREGFDIHQHADHLVAPVPGGAFLPGPVHPFQLLRPLRPEAVEHLGEVVVGFEIVAVQLAVEPLQLVRVAAETEGIFFFPCCVHDGFPPVFSNLVTV